METLEARLITLEVAVGSLDALSTRLDSLFARVQDYENSVSRFD